MFSQKTNNARKYPAFLIALPLILLNGSVIGLLSDQMIHSKDVSVKAVKNETVTALDASELSLSIEQDQALEVTLEQKPAITVYTVKEGDTLSTIATTFNISTNTILWANDLTRTTKIKIGQKLIILPVTGVQYEVKKGDTISSIAKKFDGDMDEILAYNDLENAGKIKVGMELIIPNGELAVAHQKAEQKPVVKTTSPKPTQQTQTNTEIKKETPVVAVASETKTESSVDADDKVNNGAVPPVAVRGVDTSDYFSHPLKESVLTQGFHGYNAVDFGVPSGTPVFAAADGVVIVEKGANKWYGGYGNFIVIEHDNGTQTLYAHNTKNMVEVGESVTKGQQIALSGSTGRSTGPHLHFEVRGGKNPWVGKARGTQY